MRWQCTLVFFTGNIMKIYTVKWFRDLWCYRWCLKLSLLFRATISWLISYVVTKKFLGLNWKIWNEHLIKHVSNCVSSQLYFIRANMNLRVYCNITSSKKVNYSLLKSVNNKLLSWSFIWVISEKAILYFESVEQ